MQWRSAFCIVGRGKSRAWRRLSGVKEVPVLDIKCPTYSTSLRPSLVFAGFAVTSLGTRWTWLHQAQDVGLGTRWTLTPFCGPRLFDDTYFHKCIHLFSDLLSIVFIDDNLHGFHRCRCSMYFGSKDIDELKDEGSKSNSTVILWGTCWRIVRLGLVLWWPNTCSHQYHSRMHRFVRYE